MQWLIAITIAALVAIVFGAIFHKMGFSRLTGILVMIPLVNLFWWLYLATSEWPIERNLAERGEPDQRPQEDHITLMLKRAEMFEKRGDFPEALKLFDILAEELDGKPGAHFAKHCADRLRGCIGAT
jgi:hypothetical protein